MARTDSDAVKSVLRLGTQGGDYNDVANPSLTPYIDWATAIVDRVLACDDLKDDVITLSVAELMERYLAAHAYCMSDQTYAEKSTQRSAAVFAGRTGMYLEATKYGQQAILLDPSGCLASLGKRQKVGMTWLGRAPSEQTDYVDRD